MVAQLTTGERQLAIVVLSLVALVGLAMAAAGRGDPIGVHGFIVIWQFAVGLIFVVLCAHLRTGAVPRAARALL